MLGHRVWITLALFCAVRYTGKVRNVLRDATLETKRLNKKRTAHSLCKAGIRHFLTVLVVAEFFVFKH